MKGHQVQGNRKNWKVKIVINNFCDKYAKSGRIMGHKGEADPIFPDQKYGIAWEGNRLHRSL